MTNAISPANSYAVVVGIDSYPDLKSLQGPTHDATEFAEWLDTSGLCPRANHFLILTPSPADPTPRPIKDEIDEALSQIFARADAANPGRLYVYFAGHGAADEFNHLALIMANAKMDRLNRSLNSTLYEEHLARRGGLSEQLFFYDCCRTYDERVTGMGPDASNATEKEALAADVDQFVFYAAGFGQAAFEKEMEFSERRGLFTRALLEGLKGQAAEERDGQWVVTADKLKAYVHDRVNELAKGLSLKQRTHHGSRGSGKVLTINVLPAPPRRQLQVAGPPGDGIEVVILDQKLREVGRHPLVGGAATIDLLPGVYVVRLEPDNGKMEVADLKLSNQSVSLEP